MPTIPATFSVPARRLRSCFPPVNCATRRSPRRIHNRAGALRPVKLVRRERQQVDAEAGHVDGNLAHRLHGIGVKKCAFFVREPGQLRHGLDGANFVVGVHHRDERGLVGQGSPQPIRVDDSAFVHGQQRHLPSPAGQRLNRIEHGLVLDGAGNEVLPSRNSQRFGNALDGQVVAFGAAAGEHDLGRFGRNQGGDRGSGVIGCRLGLLPEMMHAGRISPSFGERLGHSLDDRWGRGRRGVVVQVDAVHGYFGLKGQSAHDRSTSR